MGVTGDIRFWQKVIIVVLVAVVVIGFFFFPIFTTPLNESGTAELRSAFEIIMQEHFGIQ